MFRSVRPSYSQRMASRRRFAASLPGGGGKPPAIAATCPLVTKVHLEAIRYAKEGYTILLIGHEGHDEVIGTMGEAPHAMVLVESAEHAARLELPAGRKVADPPQTPLSVDDANRIINVRKARFPQIDSPPKDDICYATQNRQE